MSLRLRLLALVGAVAVSAVAATAYLAYTQNARQVTESAVADYETSQEIVTELAAYARNHAGWDGIGPFVGELAGRTGQRIRLVGEADAVLADSDTLAGGPARPVDTLPIAIDPRPMLSLPTSPVLPEGRVAEVTATTIAAYRHGLRLADCLTRHGLAVAVSAGSYGVPVYEVDESARVANSDLVAACSEEAGPSKPASDELLEADSCILPDDRPTTAESRGNPTQAVAQCLEQLFAQQTADIGPGPVRLYLGAAAVPASPLRPGPVIAAAGLVALFALGGTVLVSRQMLRPIRALTAASRQLGEGNLDRRVPVRGRDEVADLARSFNRMADSLQQAEHWQRRLIADVAHELRTPLANLRGYLEALKDGVVAGDPRLFQNLHREAVLQQRIVDDLQDLALAEAGVLAYHWSQVDLAELLATCRTAHQTAADGAGVALHLDTGEPVVVHADPDRVRQVLGNLISNAIRATPAGGSVTLRLSFPGPDTCAVHVADTGVGIDPADLPHIFDRFWRADPARGRATGGSGLGLAIARQIVTDHCGEISAASRPGHGTTVTITLPRSADGSGRHRGPVMHG
jgi:two-component system sensor histidine kinase BaeS